MDENLSNVAADPTPQVPVQQNSKSTLRLFLVIFVVLLFILGGTALFFSTRQKTQIQEEQVTKTPSVTVTPKLPTNDTEQLKQKVDPNIAFP